MTYARKFEVKMIVFEVKLDGTKQQFEAIDEAIQTARFVQNQCLKLWMENKGTTRNDLYKYCKVQRQCKDFACKLARCVVKSADLVAFENLKIRNRVKNRHWSKSISDAAWDEFQRGLEYFGKMFGVVTVAVAPNFTRMSK